MPRWVLAVLFCCLLPLVASCAGTPSSGSGGGVFRVGAIYPITGPQAKGGQEELAGVELALSLARQRHAFGSRQVQLVVRDAETPNAARAAVDYLLDSQHVDMLLGTYGSTLSEAASARAEERHAVYWETGAVADDVTSGKRYVFRTVATGSTLGRTAVDFTANVLVPSNHLSSRDASAVIVYVDDAYGRSVAFGESQRAKARGIRVLSMIGYNPNVYDAAQLVGEVKGLKPAFLWDVSYIDDGIAVWREAVRQKVHLVGAVGTSSAWCMPEFGASLGPEAAGVYAADKPDEHVNPDALTADARSLLADATAVYARDHSGQSMGIPAVAGFVGGWTLFTKVVAKVKAFDADSIRSAALTVNVPQGGAINGGGVRFGAAGSDNAGQNQLAASDVGVWQYTGVVKMKVVYPAAYAGAPATVTSPGMAW